MNSLKETNVQNRSHCSFDDMINIRNLDLNKIKVDEKLYRTIFTYYISYEATNSVKHLYLEESNEEKYLTLVPADGSKNTPNNYRIKSEILLDQQAMTQMIMIKNI